MIRIVNNYQIETHGGFITVKHMIVSDKENNHMGTYFKYGKAKAACLRNDFNDAYKGKLYN